MRVIGLLELGEDHIEEIGTRAFGTHAMGKIDQERGIAPSRLGQHADRLVEGHVDIEDRIARFRCDHRIMAFMRWVVDVPSHMARVMGVVKDGDQQIPGSLLQEITCESRLGSNAMDQVITKRGDLGRRLELDMVGGAPTSAREGILAIFPADRGCEV